MPQESAVLATTKTRFRPLLMATLATSVIGNVAGLMFSDSIYGQESDSLANAALAQDAGTLLVCVVTMLLIARERPFGMPGLVGLGVAGLNPLPVGSSRVHSRRDPECPCLSCLLWRRSSSPPSCRGLHRPCQSMAISTSLDGLCSRYVRTEVHIAVCSRSALANAALAGTGERLVCHGRRSQPRRAQRSGLTFRSQGESEMWSDSRSMGLVRVILRW